MTEICFKYDKPGILSEKILSVSSATSRVVSVRIPPKTHNAVVKTFQYGRDAFKAAPVEFCNIYDASCVAGLKHGSECGMLYGVPVYLDYTLADQQVVLVYETIDQM